MKRTFLMCLMVRQAASDNAQPVTGVAATVSFNGLRTLSRALVPILEDLIPAIVLPDVPFSELTLAGNLTGLQCSQALIGGLDVHSDAGGSGSGGGETLLVAQAYNVSLLCTAQFMYREEHWPYWPSGQGSMELQVGGANIGARVAIRGKYAGSDRCAAPAGPRKDVPPDAPSQPRPGVGQSLCLSTQDVAVDVGDMQVRFTAGQPVLVWVLNLLVDLFCSKVQSSLIQRAQDGIRKVIDETASGALQNATQTHPVQVPVPTFPPAWSDQHRPEDVWQALSFVHATVSTAPQPGKSTVRLGRRRPRAEDEPIVLGVRTSLSEAPHVHGNSSYEPGKGHVHLALRADVVPSVTRHPHAALPLTCPPKPVLGPTAPGHHVQLWLSNYSMASPLYALSASGAARVTVPSALLPEAFNTTQQWKPIVPALPDAFGTGVGVGLRVSLPEEAPLPQVQGSAWPMGQGSLSLSLCPQVDVQVYEEQGGPGVTAVRWNASLLLNVSMWVPMQGEEETPMLHINISAASLVMDGDDVWTAPALAKDPTVNTDLVNRLLDMGLTRVLLPLINRALSKGVQLPVIPLGPLPGTHGGEAQQVGPLPGTHGAHDGGEAQQVGLQLRNTRLFASGPAEDGSGSSGEDAGIDGSPTSSAGLFLKTDLQLVVQPAMHKGGHDGLAWVPLALRGEGVDAMAVWLVNATASAYGGRSIGRLGSLGRPIALT